MTSTFRKRAKPRKFQKSDLVLKVLRGLINHPRGKFRPSWSGPYVIRDLTREGAAWLTDLDGNQFTELVNVDQLKRFYPLSLTRFIMAYSFIHPCILFLTWVGGLSLCAFYLLIGSVSIMSIVSFFVCSFSHHCLFLFFSILHLHTICL